MHKQSVAGAAQKVAHGQPMPNVLQQVSGTTRFPRGACIRAGARISRPSPPRSRVGPEPEPSSLDSEMDDTLSFTELPCASVSPGFIAVTGTCSGRGSTRCIWLTFLVIPVLIRRLFGGIDPFVNFLFAVVPINTQTANFS